MDRTIGTPAQPRIQDVTPQILKTHTIYGASDYTAPHRYASGKSLNYTSGGSIHSPEHERVGITPYTLKYQDSVGLFGAENYFVRVSLDVDGSVAFSCYEEIGWQCANILDTDTEEIYWDMAEIDYLHDVPIDSDQYLQAVITENNVPNFNKTEQYFSVDLHNLKTGNIHNDDWLDVRLYTSNREEHPFDRMYVHAHDFFYIGFHARNTRRLPYNVECVIGEELTYYDLIENKQYIMRR